MPATDRFKELYAGNVAGADWPADNFAAVTPHDTNELSFVTRGLMVGAAGNVKVDGGRGGVAVVLPALQPGVVYPFRVKKIYATDTTATGIVALE